MKDQHVDCFSRWDSTGRAWNRWIIDSGSKELSATLTWDDSMWCGSNPILYAQIVEDLQTTHIEKACIKQMDMSVKKLLIAMNFLKCYKSKEVRGGKFDVSEKMSWKWGGSFLRRYKLSKHKRFIWLESWNDGHPLLHNDDTPIFLVSIDGVHCRINELMHPTLSKNPIYYLHKFKEAALTYKLAVSVYENKLVHIKGPKLALKHNITTWFQLVREQLATMDIMVNLILPQELHCFKSQAQAHTSWVIQWLNQKLQVSCWAIPSWEA